MWGSKIDEQTMKNDVKNKNDFKRLRNRFCIDFGTQLASWGGPRTPFLTFFALLEPSWGEDGSRMRQDRFPDGFFTDSKWLLIVFRWICHVLAAVSSYVKARSAHWIWSAMSFHPLVLCPSISCWLDHSIAESLHPGTVAEMARRATGYICGC